MMPLWIRATRPVRTEVRVGVDVGRGAVGGPPGVPDARWSTPAAAARRGTSRGWPACPARLSCQQRSRRGPARCRRSRSRGTPAGAVPRSRRPAPACLPTYPTIPHMAASLSAAAGPAGRPTAGPATMRDMAEVTGRAAAGRTGREASPYVELDRAAWAGLSATANGPPTTARSPPRRSPGSAASATRSTSTRCARSTCRCRGC